MVPDFSNIVATLRRGEYTPFVESFLRICPHNKIHDPEIETLLKSQLINVQHELSRYSDNLLQKLISEVLEHPDLRFPILATYQLKIINLVPNTSFQVYRLYDEHAVLVIETDPDHELLKLHTCEASPTGIIGIYEIGYRMPNVFIITQLANIFHYPKVTEAHLTFKMALLLQEMMS